MTHLMERAILNSWISSALNSYIDDSVDLMSVNLMIQITSRSLNAFDIDARQSKLAARRMVPAFIGARTYGDTLV